MAFQSERTKNNTLLCTYCLLSHAVAQDVPDVNGFWKMAEFKYEYLSLVQPKCI